jgi:hypothetical protein
VLSSAYTSGQRTAASSTMQKQNIILMGVLQGREKKPGFLKKPGF